MAGHKHAALALQYWAEAQKDAEAWKNWEVMEGKRWVPLQNIPSFNILNEYRRRPQVIVINGIEVPEPVRKPLENGEEYWIVHIDCVDNFSWAGDNHDRRWLARGIMHRTKEAAETHARALLSFTRKEEQ